jgi:molybdenum cofactor guanylyltransferase
MACGPDPERISGDPIPRGGGRIVGARLLDRDPCDTSSTGSAPENIKELCAAPLTVHWRDETVSSIEKFSVIVLAGGRATRLGGVNKATIEVDGRRLIDRVLDAVLPLTDDVRIVGNLVPDAAGPSVQVVPDALPHRSSLVGVYTGLLSARYELALVVGCDMPFLSTPMLRLVAGAALGYDAAVPRIGSHLEALHAAYRRSCLPVIRTELQRQKYAVIDIYPRVHTLEIEESALRQIDPELRSLMNVNTLADLERARALSGEG